MHATTVDITLESLHKRVQDLTALIRPPDHDVIVMTAEAYSQLKQRLESAAMTKTTLGISEIAGLPFEVYGTKEEAIRRIWKLQKAGRRPMLVC
jgi:vacuolar-type H+-ATPase subunit F/Vma7